MPSSRHRPTCARAPCALRGAAHGRSRLQEDSTLLQRVLAVALTLILGLTAVNIAFRILLVMWTLVGAAVRYSVVAIMLVVAGALFL